MEGQDAEAMFSELDRQALLPVKPAASQAAHLGQDN